MDPSFRRGCRSIGAALKNELKQRGVNVMTATKARVLLVEMAGRRLRS